MSRKRMIHAKVLLPNGKTEVFLLAKKISKGLYWDYKMSGDKSVFRMLKGCYITVPISQYNDKRQAKMVVGKILAIFWRSTVPETLFTRSQFVTEEHLTQSMHECYRYLRHDYDRASKVRIFLSLAYWKFKAKPRRKVSRKTEGANKWQTTKKMRTTC